MRHRARMFVEKFERNDLLRWFSFFDTHERIYRSKQL